VKSALKRAALVTLTREPLASLFEPLTRRHAAIFYLHRFEEPGAGLLRHDTAQLRTTLEFLRRRRFTVLPLDGLLDRLAEGRPLRRTLAFTVDDGYMDFHSLGAPVFAEFDCPVTVFLTTGFLDGELWPWWDRIEYAFQRTTRRSLALDLGDSARTFSWDRRDGRVSEQDRRGTEDVARAQPAGGPRPDPGSAGDRDTGSAAAGVRAHELGSGPRRRAAGSDVRSA